MLASKLGVPQGVLLNEDASLYDFTIRGHIRM